MTEKTLTYDDLRIADRELYDEMGYRGNTPDDTMRQETAAVVAEVSRWLKPRLCYQVVRELPPFSLSRIISRQLRGSEAYALFICTAGMEYEDYQRHLMDEGDMVRVFIANALGTVIAEHCADRMEDTLQASIDKLQWHHTNRFSPGYCGWHVSEQQILFAQFTPAQPATAPTAAPSFSVGCGSAATPLPAPCGVRLTDSSLMIPIKSVSGIIGLGRNVSHNDYTCGLCDFEKCYKKRKR